MKLRRNSQSRTTGPGAPRAPFDAQSFVEVRNSRIVRCREHRNRYLIQRGVHSAAQPNRSEALPSHWRHLPAIAAAAFLTVVTLSAVFDGLRLVRGGTSWLSLSYWGLGVGALLGLVTALGSAVLWRSSPPGSTARVVSTTLGLGSIVVVLLASGSWLTRPDSVTAPDTVALLLAFMAAGVAIVTGGLAGELIGGRSAQPAVAMSSSMRQRRPSALTDIDEEPESIAARA